MDGWPPSGAAGTAWHVASSGYSRAVCVLLPDLAWKVADVGHEDEALSDESRPRRQVAQARTHGPGWLGHQFQTLHGLVCASEDEHHRCDESISITPLTLGAGTSPHVLMPWMNSSPSMTMSPV
jgi:hypothetical protein